MWLGGPIEKKRQNLVLPAIAILFSSMYACIFVLLMGAKDQAWVFVFIQQVLS